MINFTVHTDLDVNAISKRATMAEKVLANQVLKDTRPFVPALTMSLNQRSHVEGNKVIYPGPYARYLYYGKVMVDENGRPAFPTKDGFRHRKGAVLHATEKDLVFTKSVHPQAQAHWFEASKAVNLDKWKRVMGRFIANGRGTEE